MGKSMVQDKSLGTIFMAKIGFLTSAESDILLYAIAIWTFDKPLCTNLQ